MTALKKEGGGVSGEVWLWSQIQWVFFKPSLTRSAPIWGWTRWDDCTDDWQWRTRSSQHACWTGMWYHTYHIVCIHTILQTSSLPPYATPSKYFFGYRSDPTPPTATPLPPTCTRLSPALEASPLAEATAPTVLHRCKWSEDFKFVTIASFDTYIKNIFS